jgi:2-succinyl-6-hydroxy-2,4-cyclohexadiene-1-carboxylate synthase
MTRFLVNGVRLEVRALGAGLPVLLLHGFTGRSTNWTTLAALLRRLGRRTIVVDLLGHGRSDAPSDPARYAIGRQADDLLSLLDRLGARPADLVGYSMGARIALRLAADRPDAVRRLVLESPSAGIADAAERVARRGRDEALALGLERDGIEAFVRHWERQPVFASHAALPSGAQARLRVERLGNRPIGLAASLRGAGQGVADPLHDRLGTITVETLVIAGALDPVGLGRAEAVRDAIPRARLEVVAGAGHAPHLERPAAYRRLVVAFLGASTPARSATPTDSRSRR